MTYRTDVGTKTVADAQMAVILVSVVGYMVAFRTEEAVFSRERFRRFHDVTVRCRFRWTTPSSPREVAFADRSARSCLVAVLAGCLFERISPFLLREYLASVSKSDRRTFRLRQMTFFLPDIPNAGFRRSVVSSLLSLPWSTAPTAA